MLNPEKESLSRSIRNSMMDYLDLCAKEALAKGAAGKEAVMQGADNLRSLADCPEQCQLNYLKCIADGGDPDDCLEQKTTCISGCPNF